MTADTAEPAYWSSSLVTRLRRGAPGYPPGLVDALGPAAPAALTVVGDPEALAEEPVALLSSACCPPQLVLRAYDLACELAVRGVTLVSGFHSPVERECLRVLINGRRPVIWCPARGLAPRVLSPGYARAVTEGRLVVVTPFTRCARRVTQTAARYRNRLVVALARVVVALHVTAAGSVESGCREALSWGRPVRLLDLSGAGRLLELGARPLRSGDLPGFAPVWAWPEERLGAA